MRLCNHYGDPFSSFFRICKVLNKSLQENKDYTFNDIFCGVSVLKYFNINFYMLTTNIYLYSFCKCIQIHKVYTINMLTGVCT